MRTSVTTMEHDTSGAGTSSSLSVLRMHSRKSPNVLPTPRTSCGKPQTKHSIWQLACGACFVALLELPSSLLP